MADGVDDLKALWQELKAHVDRLASERQHYLEIFERCDDAYLLTDRNGVIEQANGAAVDFLQRRRRHLRGKPLAVLIAPDHRRRFRDSLQDLVQGEANTLSWRTAFRDPSQGQAVLNARAIGRPASGIVWLLRAVQ